MPIEERDVVRLSRPGISAAEAVYIPEVVRGFGTTIRHFFTSFGQSKIPVIGASKTTRTMQYPEERREDMPVLEGGLEKSNFRGVHRLNRDEQGRVKCVACMMCPTLCPANCIHIVAGESPWEDREKYPVKFEIDELRCIFCGMCEEACPVDAIELTPAYDVVGLSRQEMVFDKEKLLSVYDVTVSAKPM
ncbi:MAG TPA: NADH-quinone oxidoreductase subunit I [Phycisphaerales bacterium]|nr:NADH-quinone oxidoreductase subunit I [Phycisphaerales bacterium]